MTIDAVSCGVGLVASAVSQDERGPLLGGALADAAELAALEEAAARLRRHPGFRAALAEYCRGMSSPARIDWPVYKLFDQIGRYVVCYMLIHNYYAWIAGAGTAPTLTALQKVCGVSARQAAGFVAALKSGRLIITEPSPDDRRVKHLRPAPPMIAEIGRSARLFIAASDGLGGKGGGRATLLADNHDLLGDVIRRSAAYVLAHGTIIHPFPRVLHFAQRDSGYLLLTAVFAAHFGRLAPSAVEDSLSYRQLARRFQVSAAHIGSLMNEAQREGWFHTDGRGRLAGVAPDFVDEFEQWASWQMVHCTSLIEAALAAFDTAPLVEVRVPDVSAAG